MNNSLFFSLFSAMDDVYFLSAAMHCGPGTRLVSSDRFSNLVSRMDPLMKAQFRRWQNLYQMALERFVGDEPVFEVCTRYSCCFIYCVYVAEAQPPTLLPCHSFSTHISPQIAQKTPFPPQKAQLKPLPLHPPPPQKKSALFPIFSKINPFLGFLKMSVTDQLSDPRKLCTLEPEP